MNWSEVPQNLMETVNQFVSQLREHNEDLYQHSVRVSQMSRQLAKDFGLNSHEQTVAQFSGLLHDLGKIQIPSKELTRSTSLDETAKKTYGTYPLDSAELLEPLGHHPLFREVQLTILHHRECYDGTGGPYGLADVAIPLLSRLLAVVDCADVLSLEQSFSTNPESGALGEGLTTLAGKSLDPSLVTLFLEVNGQVEGEQDSSSNVLQFIKPIKAA